MPAAKKAPEPKLDLIDFVGVYNAQVGFQMPEVHASICAWLESTLDAPNRLLFAWRHVGKSHLIGLYISWRLYLDQNYTCIIVSATQGIAKDTAMFVRKILETHPLTAKICPKNDESLWQKTSFTCIRDRVQRSPSVQITSIDSSFTGKHAHELIADDIETSDNIGTTDAREHLRKREMEFGEVGEVLTYIGTPHTRESVYREVVSREGCEFAKFPVILNEVYVWPEKFGPERVNRIRARKSEAWFRTQYLLEFEDTNVSALPVEYIRSYAGEASYDQISGKLDQIEGRTIIDACAAWDAAQSREGTDDSVLSIAFRTQDGQSFLHRQQKLPPIDPELGWEPQAKVIIRIMQELRVNRIHVEENVNRALSSDLKKAANEAHVRIQIVGFSSSANKAKRIGDLMEPIISGGRLWTHKSIDQTPFSEQVADFPRSVTNKRAKDDFIDSAAMAIGNLKGGAITYDSKGTAIGGPHYRRESVQLVKADRQIGAPPPRSRVLARIAPGSMARR